jgi:hypothetical protein
MWYSLGRIVLRNLSQRIVETMKVRPCICVMVASLLLLSCVEMGWAEKKPVLDDDGNVISEEEIKANMGDRYRKGCTIGGGCLSNVPNCSTLCKL